MCISAVVEFINIIFCKILNYSKGEGGSHCKLKVTISDQIIKKKAWHIFRFPVTCVQSSVTCGTMCFHHLKSEFLRASSKKWIKSLQQFRNWQLQLLNLPIIVSFQTIAGRVISIQILNFRIAMWEKQAKFPSFSATAAKFTSFYTFLKIMKKNMCGRFYWNLKSKFRDYRINKKKKKKKKLAAFQISEGKEQKIKILKSSWEKKKETKSAYTVSNILINCSC